MLDSVVLEPTIPHVNMTEYFAQTFVRPPSDSQGDQTLVCQSMLSENGCNMAIYKSKDFMVTFSILKENNLHYVALFLTRHDSDSKEGISTETRRQKFSFLSDVPTIQAQLYSKALLGQSTKPKSFLQRIFGNSLN